MRIAGLCLKWEDSNPLSYLLAVEQDGVKLGVGTHTVQPRLLRNNANLDFIGKK
jgi:hypothetical protein